ncbi:hypothetical protein PVK06_007910 [Gossypium arboreum]|uniref:Uncharacterized protein n=1 Tax=Gossypium arboreum TaxID=29729 RepID=A0ABR0QIK7_GOSAR|nr:hypothetical protein PVK06_007910 [Gossypium arboreum]
MRLKLRHMRRKSAQELEMSFNLINLDNIFEEDDPLNAWIEEKEDYILDSEQNFSWLPEELLKLMKKLKVCDRRDVGDRTHRRMREHFHDSFAGSS